jgi:hypothetical protein
MAPLLPDIASLQEIPAQSYARTSREYRALEAEFDRIWAKYGFKSMVMDRRRRCSTRRGNQRFQRAVSRSKKRSDKDKLRLALIKELSQ